MTTEIGPPVAAGAVVAAPDFAVVVLRSTMLSFVCAALMAAGLPLLCAVASARRARLRRWRWRALAGL